MNKAIAVPQIDLLWALVLVFMGLFAIMSFANETEDSKKHAVIDLPVRYVLTMEWDDKSHSDIDMYLLTPRDGIVYYSRKEISLINLERDDLGVDYDLIETERTISQYQYNKEIIFFRDAPPGRYQVNPYWYGKKSMSNDIEEVKITLTQVNPTYSEIHSKTVYLKNLRTEEPGFGFTFDENGDVTIHVEEVRFVLDFKRDVSQ